MNSSIIVVFVAGFPAHLLVFGTINLKAGTADGHGAGSGNFNNPEGAKGFNAGRDLSLIPGDFNSDRARPRVHYAASEYLCDL